MKTLRSWSMSSTESSPYVDVDLQTAVTSPWDAVAAMGAESTRPALAEFGCHWGTAEMFDLAREPHESAQAPALLPQGISADIVEFHPAYHHYMARKHSRRVACFDWATSDAGPAAPPAQVLRSACFDGRADPNRTVLHHHDAGGSGCARSRAGARDQAWPGNSFARVRSALYAVVEENGHHAWNGRTENRGGACNTFAANTTRAQREGVSAAITGDKWFMSAPMCDAFLVLAQAPGGLTCFLMPQFRPDGAVNALRFVRLKDKLGIVSSHPRRVEFTGAFAWLVGEEGRGVRTIINMVQLTLFGTAYRTSAAIMRMALAQALHHARHRSVSDRLLVEQPLMRRALADMAIEVEAATVLVMRLARSFDLAAGNAQEGKHGGARSRQL